jgi:hypothetical protein
MDVLHWVLLILFLFTGFTLTPFAIGFLILLMKQKGGSPIGRGVFCLAFSDMGVRRFFARWDGGNWKKSSGAAREFIVNESTSLFFRGKEYPHRVMEDDAYIREEKNETLVISGISHMNLEFQRKYHIEKQENDRLKSELSTALLKLHEANTQIEQKIERQIDTRITQIQKIIPQPKTRQTTTN